MKVTLIKLHFITILLDLLKNHSLLHNNLNIQYNLHIDK